MKNKSKTLKRRIELKMYSMLSKVLPKHFSIMAKRGFMANDRYHMLQQVFEYRRNEMVELKENSAINLIPYRSYVNVGQSFIVNKATSEK